MHHLKSPSDLFPPFSLEGPSVPVIVSDSQEDGKKDYALYMPVQKKCDRREKSDERKHVTHLFELKAKPYQC